MARETSGFQLSTLSWGTGGCSTHAGPSHRTRPCGCRTSAVHPHAASPNVGAGRLTGGGDGTIVHRRLAIALSPSRLSDGYERAATLAAGLDAARLDTIEEEARRVAHATALAPR